MHMVPPNSDAIFHKDNQLRAPWSSAGPSPNLLLPFGFDQLQHPEHLLSDVRQGDRQPDALRVENAETPPDEGAVRRIHRLFEQFLRTAGARG